MRIAGNDIILDWTEVPAEIRDFLEEEVLDRDPQGGCVVICGETGKWDYFPKLPDDWDCSYLRFRGFPGFLLGKFRDRSFEVGESVFKNDLIEIIVEDVTEFGVSFAAVSPISPGAIVEVQPSANWWEIWVSWP